MKRLHAVATGLRRTRFSPILAIPLSVMFAMSLNALAMETNNGRCFEQHIRDAIQLNKKRKPLYLDLSGGESREISAIMILMERFLLPIAWHFDREAMYLRNEAQPRLMCDEFVSMDDTPEFRSQIMPTTGTPPQMESLDASPIIERLTFAQKDGETPRLKEQTIRELESIAGYPSYYCMTRHFLESIGRAAHLAPGYNEAGRKLLQEFIDLQIFGLRTAAYLDRKAAPLQARGIAIICQDIPAIPIH